MPTRSKAFTLIELLVVVSIIGILATLLIANLNSARSRARDSVRKSDLKNIATALRLYYNDKGYYPNNNSGGQILGCSSYTSPTACTWGSSWTVGSTSYMPVLPKDPLPNQTYKYAVGSGQDTFTLSACLENTSDTSGVTETNTTWCSTNWKYQIQI